MLSNVVVAGCVLGEHASTLVMLFESLGSLLSNVM